MLLGLLLVGVSAAGFGFALFGHRPEPQPATRTGSAPSMGDAAEPQLTSAGGAPQQGIGVQPALAVGRVQRMLQREATADHEPVVRFTAWLRLRSTLALALVVLGTGAILGVLLTVVIVGSVFIIT